MGEKFNTELNKIQNMKNYNKTKQRLLDDMATAYISDSFNGLDESLISVKSMRKALRANGYTVQEIDDFLVEYSYITKRQIRLYYNQSIYNEDLTVRKEVEAIPTFYNEQCLTDSIIEELNKRPKLLKALKKGVNKSYLSRDLNIKNPVLLQDFYNKHKAIIDI